MHGAAGGASDLGRLSWEARPEAELLAVKEKLLTL